MSQPFQSDGRVSEWFKEPVLKTGVRETVPWVRIPPLPPYYIDFVAQLPLSARELHACHNSASYENRQADKAGGAFVEHQGWFSGAAG